MRPRRDRAHLGAAQGDGRAERARAQAARAAAGARVRLPVSPDANARGSPERRDVIRQARGFRGPGL